MDTEQAEKLLKRYRTLKMKKRGVGEALDALASHDSVPVTASIEVSYKESRKKLFWCDIPLDLSEQLLEKLRSRLSTRINLVEELLEPMNDLAEEELEQPV